MCRNRYHIKHIGGGIDMSITVITVAQNDSGLVRHMIDSVNLHSKVNPKIIVCDNGGNKKFLDKYKSDSSIRIVKNKPKSRDAANIHGECLDKIFPMVDTKYTAIMDSDCVILSDDWATVDSKYRIVTAKKGVKTIDKHYFCFVVFETAALIGTSFRPVHARKDKKLPWDTGCMVSQKIYDNNIPIENLSVVKCGTGDGKVFGDRFPKSFELWRGDDPIVAHFGAGSDLPRRRTNKYGEGYPKQLKEWNTAISQHLDEVTDNDK